MLTTIISLALLLYSLRLTLQFMNHHMSKRKGIRIMPGSAYTAWPTDKYNKKD
jgi:uncharacterized membrane protein SirB2